MRKLNNILIYDEKTLNYWSESRLMKWRSRVKNHLDGIKKNHINANIAKYDINEFEKYIKLIETVIKNKENIKINYDNINIKNLSG